MKIGIYGGRYMKKFFVKEERVADIPEGLEAEYQ